MPTQQHAPNLVYVLRLWCDGTKAPWRATLERASTGEQLSFAVLAAMTHEIPILL